MRATLGKARGKVGRSTPENLCVLRVLRGSSCLLRSDRMLKNVLQPGVPRPIHQFKIPHAVVGMKPAHPLPVFGSERRQKLLRVFRWIELGDFVQ